MSDLTREQILSLSAGMDMDALIAERVFKQCPPSPSEMVRLRRLGAWSCDRYSVDANAMMQVIENRRQAGYDLTARWRPKLFDWWVDFQDKDGFSNASYGCDDLILSVCRAALLTTLEEA